MTNRSDTSEAYWSNYWQGRTGTEAGAALTGVGVENHAEISTFWARLFKSQEKTIKVLDLACGAGSVLKVAAENGVEHLTGADISPAAIDVLSEGVPSAKGVVTHLDNLPFDDQAFGLVTSQFGFEYAGVEKCAAEIGRVLKPGGEFIALAHRAGGAIETEVRAKLQFANRIIDTNFIALAIQVFEVDMSGGTNAEFEQAATAFAPAQARVMTLAKSHGGLAAHLYQGTQQLYEKRQAYAFQDIKGWLDGMRGEIEAFAARMQSMIDAALSETDIESLRAAFKENGVNLDAPEVFEVAGPTGASKDAIAWHLVATKA